MPSQTLTPEVDGYRDGTNWFNSPLYIGSVNQAGFSYKLTTAIPAGATITKCYFRGFRLVDSGAAGISATLGLENADPASVGAFGSGKLSSDATLVGTVTTTAVNWVDYQNVWMFGEADNLPANLTSQMQSLATSFGAMAINERINVVVGMTGGAAYAQFEDSSAGLGHPAELYIEWTAGSDTALAGDATAQATSSAALTTAKLLNSAAAAVALATAALDQALRAAAVAQASGQGNLTGTALTAAAAAAATVQGNLTGAAAQLAGAANAVMTASGAIIDRQFRVQLYYGPNGIDPVTGKTVWYAWFPSIAAMQAAAVAAGGAFGTNKVLDGTGALLTAALPGSTIGEDQGFGVVSDQDATADDAEGAYVGSFDIQ